MSILSRLGGGARYNIFTPAFLLSLASPVPALAANFDWVITAPATNVDLDVNDSLVNHSTINGNLREAVYSAYDIRFIENRAGATIDGGDYPAIFIEGSVGRIENAGEILSDGINAIVVVGDVTDFINSGTILATDGSSVYLQGDVTSFSNTGHITAYGNGVTVEGHVENFSNENEISSEIGEGVYLGSAGEFFNSGEISTIAAASTSFEFDAVYVNDHVKRFINNGDIISASGDGVDIGAVDYFENNGNITAGDTGLHIGNFNSYSESIIRNSGDITSTDGTAVSVGYGAKRFENIGNIRGEDYGFYAEGPIETFLNSGHIHAEDNAAISASYVEHFENTGEIRSDSLTMAAVDIDEAGTVINSGLIRSLADDGLSGYRALRIGNDGVGTIHNTASGRIIARETAILIEGDAGRIVNNGKITSANGSGISITGELTDFINTGTIEADNIALYVDKDAGSIFNSGHIESYGVEALYFNQDVESIVNTGTIIGDNEAIKVGGDAGSISNSKTITSTDETAIHVVGDLAEFQNTGWITGAYSGLRVESELKLFSNSGHITGEDFSGVFVNGKAAHVDNSGTIVGGTAGVYFNVGDSYLKNSGTIEGTGGTAVQLTGDNNTVAIGTGARFIGEIDFAGGDNTYLDARDFHGSIIIDVENNTLDMGNVHAGQNYYYQDSNTVYVVGGGFINQVSQPVINLATGLGELAAGKLALGSAGGTYDSALMGYSPVEPSQAATATYAALQDPASSYYWADAIGGAGRNSGADASDVYGALIAGAHTQLSDELTLGVLGGFAHAALDVGSGSQTVKSTIGVVGAYGSYDLGGIETDFSLIGGLSGNDSAREIIDGDITDTATAAYGGWFIAPTIGAYLPVLATETGDVSVGGRLGYLAGGFGGYTEDGTGADLTVGAQNYGVLTALVEVRGENAVSDTVTINGSLGAFVQNQHGNAVDVSIAGVVPLVGPDSVGGTSFGVKAGVGAEVAISDAFNIIAGVTGNWRSSGTVAASANLGIGGKF